MSVWQKAISPVAITSQTREKSVPNPEFPREHWVELLKSLTSHHPSSSHPLFAYLNICELTSAQIARLLRNYDAHASVLRRLLLKASCIMPEKAVGFILENVRNEYGNGNGNHRHQLQLIDLADKCGVSKYDFATAKISPGIKRYISQITPLYWPLKSKIPKSYFRPAIAAGAITATELMAIQEFKSMQCAFTKLGLGQHVWFDHVNSEVEHADGSLDLALSFIDEYHKQEEVIFGINAVLKANLSLYDGLFAVLQ